MLLDPFFHLPNLRDEWDHLGSPHSLEAMSLTSMMKRSLLPNVLNNRARDMMLQLLARLHPTEELDAVLEFIDSPASGVVSLPVSIPSLQNRPPAQRQFALPWNSEFPTLEYPPSSHPSDENPRSSDTFIGGNVNNAQRHGEVGLHILSRAIAGDAFHDSAERFPQPRCRPETRTKLLNALKNRVSGINPPRNWTAEDFFDDIGHGPPESSSGILWLHGPAGSGKSAVAQSFCQQWKDECLADTGSDITLISRKTLNALLDAPKVKQGHQVELIQVTGTSSISGYVNLDLIFHTEDGPVKLNVDGYVVDDMTTPFILGNDFMDQYSISIIRQEGTTHLGFGDSGRRLLVENSTSPPLVDNEGHAFEVKCARAKVDAGSKQATHRRNQKFRQRARKKERDGRVTSTERVVILPKTSKLVKVATYFPKDCEQLLVEKHMKSCGNSDDIYGSADTFISKPNPALHIVNFSDFPVIISEGQVLGTAHNPRTWLDKASKMSATRRKQAEAHANFIRKLVEIQSSEAPTSSNTVRSDTKVSSKAHRNATGENDPDAEEPVEGGPKTAEAPPGSVDSSKLLEQIDISERSSRALNPVRSTSRHRRSPRTPNRRAARPFRSPRHSGPQSSR
ncbi:hypothetical protein B0H14DRAFT_3491884 [Mycena olivaceomarginata]|nr:hypothetical protein B0H14DRAFT_3491884 [Mycena olivaceomarginata]